MLLKSRFYFLIIFTFLTASAYAQVSPTLKHLTPQEIERVRVVEELLQGVDKKSLWATVHELEKTRHPQISLQMREAMAKAYADIVREVNVQDPKKKEWLYSMICLNMAYLQFGGSQGAPGSTSELNRLIRQKLKEYLPVAVFNQSGFLYSLQ